MGKPPQEGLKILIYNSQTLVKLCFVNEIMKLGPSNDGEKPYLDVWSDI